MTKFKYYIIFKSSGTLEGTWTGVIEEFTELFINPNINDIYSYQIWENTDPDVDDLVSQKRDMDMFDEMIEQHEKEQLEQDVVQQWACE